MASPAIKPPRIDADTIRRLLGNAAGPGPPEGGGYRSACVFLLLFERSGLHVLAIQKSDNEGYPWRNQVALPGGHIDAGDTSALQAAYRELREEVNIGREQVDYLGCTGHFQTINSRDIQVFVGWWKGTGPLKYEAAEISRVLEIPLEELLKTHLERNYHGRIPGVSELTYPFRDVVIWGVTARILHHFIELLYLLLVEAGGRLQTEETQTR